MTAGKDRGSRARPGSAGASAVELRRSICEVSERISQLEAERCALEEVVQNLEADDRDLGLRVSALHEANAELDAEIDERSRRIHSSEAEIEEIQEQLVVLRLRCDANARSLKRLAREAALLEDELRAHRHEQSAARVALRSMQDSVARMDRKLVFAERKLHADLEPLD